MQWQTRKRRVGRFICGLAGILVLTGCLKVGTSEGSNAILLNAAVLKGVMGYGTVTAYDQNGAVVWEGEADETGNITMDFRNSYTGILRLSVEPNERSFMVCDALTCSDPVTEESMGFGQPIPLSGEVDFELSTRVYVDGSNSLASSLQINGLTELTSQLITFIASDDIIDSSQEFEIQAELASRLILTALGLEVESGINLLDFSLLDVNENQELGDKAENDSLLSLLNAGFAGDLRNIRVFSTTLHGLILNVLEPRLQEDFERIQKRVLRHVLNLAQSGQLGGIPRNVMRQIENAANVPFNFEQLNQLFAEMNNTNRSFALPSLAPFVANSVSFSISDLVHQAEMKAEWLVIQGFSQRGRWENLSHIETQWLQEQADGNANLSYRVWLNTLKPYLAYRALATQTGNDVQQTGQSHLLKVTAFSVETL